MPLYVAACGGEPTDPEGPPTLEEITGSSGQTAFVGTALPLSPGVIIRNAAGEPLAGIQVAFRVTAGAGSVEPAVASTDAQGRARVAFWTLGEQPGENRLAATGAGITSIITATARAGPLALAEKVGDQQQGEVNTAVARALGVILRDRFQNPMADIAVTFSVVSGGGRLDSTETRTNTSGLASAGRLTLGARVGENVVRASVGGLPTVDIVATARAGPPATLLKSGDNQTAVVGTTVPVPIIVQVSDAAGNPLPNVDVTFAVARGGGSISGERATTDSLGAVRLGSWRLGIIAGINELRITAAAASAIVSATALPDIPAAIATVSGDQQTDTVDAVLPNRPTVRVSDRYGNPVPGIAVAFAVATGGGRIGAATMTDARGEATVLWTLGSDAGLNSMTASVTGVMQAVFFTATAEWPTFAALTVAIGVTHTCALDRAKRAFCWGSNSDGQLGDNTLIDRPYARPVATSLLFESLVAGPMHTCGLTAGGSAYCWGENMNGQLGDGSFADRRVPVPVAGGLQFTSITIGSGHTCGLTNSGEAYCWGNGFFSQMGNGVAVTPVPGLVSGRFRFRAVSAGSVHTCGILDDGSTQCWGLGADGRLGDGDTQQRPFPVLVKGGHTFTALGAGGEHTCALDANKQLFCWGANMWGELGDGTTVTRLTPQAAAGALRFASIAPGYGTTCGVTVDSRAYCWGVDGLCQLAQGVCTFEPHPIPVMISLPQATHVQAIFMSGLSGCATAAVTLLLYCWGANGYGELGDGTTALRSTPTRVRAR